MRKKLKTDEDRDLDAMFNPVAHEMVRKVIDIAEDRLTSGGICDHRDTEEILCRVYIETVADIIKGASWFMQGEATAGAEYFLLKCLGSGTDRLHPLMKRMNATRSNACGNQLSFHSHYYFPRFHAILTQRYIEELQQPDDAVLIGASWNGIFHLAAAKLPGVKEQINRELRRRGLDYDAAIVPTKHLERQMRALGSHRRQIGDT
ncbi:hypothetical protein [Pseudogemmobacter sonorensis]|uniref:hypothetical protein n=1 Tax=Pseudogemmobacter sonorensis TaxID=2989681 RepID=UPI0036A5512F